MYPEKFLELLNSSLARRVLTQMPLRTSTKNYFLFIFKVVGNIKVVMRHVYLLLSKDGEINTYIAAVAK
jgi:hypothetical protein